MTTVVADKIAINTVIHGDCFEVLREMPNNSVDSVVTDPPYGLSKEPDIEEVLTKWLAGEDYEHRGGGFMGKSWDSFVPGPSIWREVYRVLKPGGHALVFAGTRTQDLMTISLRLAGFEIRDVIEWLYFSGFPKSMDIGKKMDEKERGMLVRKKILQIMRSRNITAPELAKKAGLASVASIRDWLIGGHVPSEKNWKLIKTALELTPEEEAEVERLKIGERVKLESFQYKGNNVYQTNGDKDKVTLDITTPATDLAKKWDGWGTALKPAHEPIIVARKPLIGTVAENVERWGTGALNIDGCRIPMGENEDTRRNSKGGEWREGLNTFKIRERHADDFPKRDGRFPANIVTTEPDAFWSKYCDVTAKTGNVTPKHLSKKASKKDRNSDWRGEEILKRNTHPTVKPIELMAWLCRLITPPGGIVLDPFAGSGSTLVAAKREGFNYVGIEREVEYVAIARARTGEL